MCFGTFSRRARSLATCFFFARVRIPRSVFYVIGRRFLWSFLWHKKTPGNRPGALWHAKIQQFLLSSRLYCRFWNYTRSAVIKNYGRSRTIPPVGNHTPPRRTYEFDVGNYSTYEMKNQVFLFFEFQTIMITWRWGQKLLTPLIPNCRNVEQSIGVNRLFGL